MKELLFVYERAMPTVSILEECFAPLPGLSSVFAPLRSVTAGAVEGCDILILIRPDNVAAPGLAARARKAGKFVLTALDDDLLNLPSSHPRMIWRTAALEKALRSSDALLSTSSHILEKYRHLTRLARAVRLDTILRPGDLAPLPPQKPPFPVKLVYAANASHEKLFRQYLLPVMDTLARRYGKKVELTFVGVRPELSPWEKKLSIRYIPGMGLQEYRTFMAKEQFDIGLAPLPATEFTKCKYFNKYLEYTLSGIPGIYSAAEPYTQVVENKKNGFLAENTPEGWENALFSAIEAPALRRKCLLAARSHVQSAFSQEAVFSRLLSDLPELEGFQSGSAPCPSLLPAKLLHRVFRPLDWGYLTLFYLRSTGLRGFVRRAQIHLHHRRAYQ